MSIRFRTWFIGMAFLGVAAGLVASILVWLVLTSPVTVAQALVGGL
jgi:hypothetical protein